MAHVSKPLLDRIFAEFKREADLDDIATVPAREIAERLGITRPSVTNAIRLLAAEGRVRVIGHVGRGGIDVLQLADSG